MVMDTTRKPPTAGKPSTTPPGASTCAKAIPSTTASQLDANAVKWNIDRVRHPIGDIPLYQQWAFVKEVIVVDDLTVDITTEKPHAYFEYDVSYNGCELIPPAYFEEVGQEEFNRNPVGSGPFTLVEFSENDRYVFQAWDDYHSGRPEVDRVIFQVIPEPSAQVAALLAGQIDMMTGVPVPDRENLEAADGISACSASSANVMYHYYARVEHRERRNSRRPIPDYQPATLDSQCAQSHHPRPRPSPAGGSARRRRGSPGARLLLLSGRLR